jgi:hypothetical protein
MKYLKQFESEVEYLAFKDSESFVLPNVSYIIQDNIISYSPKQPENYAILKYNVTDPSVTHVFFNTSYPTSRIQKIQIDGVNSDISATHVFQNEGIHTVVLYFKNAEDLERIFYGATMTECDLTHFDQSKVTSLYATFYNSFHLETVVLPENFAANVTNFTAAFYKNYKLKNIDVTKICTNSATTLYGIFYACSSLKELDLST